MPSNIKVLLVDDNPMVLEMLRISVAQFSSVSTLTDGADAMLKAIDDKPDLIIADYTMEAMDGRQLVQKLKSRSATANIPVILMASKTDITEKLKILQDTVEDFIEKPFFLKEAAARIKKVVDKISLEKMAREAPGESTVRGSLAQMNVMDLLQSLDMGHKTCALTLNNNGDRCQMFFSDGQINHATYGDLKGDDAVFKVLSWTGGNFEINFNGSSAEQTVTRSTQGLLLEGLRLLDESNRDTEENVLEA
ncbi:MAG TPA: response regulator [Candidatus Angelobacter sp.]|jgi:DNA-binding response OmpR family regulator|nr:response regulator [Candidatus Angelobacter sp.]